MSRDDLGRRLREAGERPWPEPDPAFTSSLEARLRAVAGEADTRGAAVVAPPPPPAARRARRPRWGTAVLAGGLVAAAIGVVALVGPGRLAPTPSASAPELTAAVNVVVTLPDGTVVDNPDGMLLPDGATVAVGADGSARIGATDLHPGETVVVSGGRLVLERPSAVASGHGSGPVAAATASASPPPGDRASSMPSAPVSTTTPGATVSPGPASPAPSAPSTSMAPAASPTPIPRPRLAASLLDPSTISIGWTRTPGARRYVLVITRSRTGAAPRPEYPGSRLQLTFTRPPSSPIELKVAAGVLEVKLMVVALDASGQELARSRIARIDLPQASPSASPSGSSSATPAPTPTPTPT